MTTKQKRDRLANMLRCYLLQCFRGDIDPALGRQLYTDLDALHPRRVDADWTGDLDGSGYTLDRPLTQQAQTALGAAYRVLRDGAGGRWLHDTRTVDDFWRIGRDDSEAMADIEHRRARGQDRPPANVPTTLKGAVAELVATIDSAARMVAPAPAPATPPDPFAGERLRLVNRESGSGDQTPPGNRTETPAPPLTPPAPIVNEGEALFRDTDEIPTTL